MTQALALSDAPERVGKFRLLAALGTGGMAEVFLAVDDASAPTFLKLVVVKRVRPHLAEDAEYTTLLLDEARISARLNHSNVVQVIEVGVEAGRPFLAMEYLDGQSFAGLRRRARERGAQISPEVDYAVLCDVLRGLQHAHDLVEFDGRPLNVVHRDVSPQNVFVTYEGHVKLLDFGIAKAAGRMAETQLGMTRGKIRYMAPEQGRSEELDRRTDIFAVGIMVWQAACNRRFWDDVPNEEVMRRLVKGEYDPSPRAVNPDVPDAIDAICRRALAFRRDDRYATAQEMLDELEAYLGEAEVEARRELTASLRTLFEKDREKRRAILEQLAEPTASLSFALDTAARRALVESPASLPIQIEGAPESDRGSDGATSISLARVLEPTLAYPSAGSAQTKRLRHVVTAFGALALLGVIAGGVGLAKRHAASAAAQRERNAVSDQRSGLSLTTDGVSLRTRATIAEIAPKPDKPPERSKPAPVQRASAAPSKRRPAPVAAPASSVKKEAPPHLDSGDPWK